MTQKQRLRYAKYFPRGNNQLLFDLELEHMLIPHIVILQTFTE